MTQSAAGLTNKRVVERRARGFAWEHRYNAQLMTRTTPQLRGVADRLLTFESDAASAAQGTETETDTAAARVCAQLEQTLGKLLGAAGFSALLSRALTLAQAEARELRAVQTKADGSLEGLEAVSRGSEIVLIAHILGLLVTFVGAALTDRLLQDMWPKAAIVKLDQGSDQ